MKETIEDFLSVAKKTALNTGRIILEFQNDPSKMLDKPDGTPLTKADIEAEREAVNTILSEYPNHKIKGEELGIQNKESRSDYLWAVDPIDGTAAYLNHEPTACVSIALLKDKEPILGLVYNPFTSELYTTTKGNCPELNKIKLPILKNDDIKGMTLNFKLKRGNIRDLEVLATIESDRQINRIISQRGSPSYGLALVAKGSHFFLFECSRKPSPEDYSAGVLLVRNAGGLVTNLDGENIDPLTEENHLVASNNPKMHEEFLNVLKTYDFGRKDSSNGKIIFIGGFYGTGKSTLAMKLEEKLGYQRFNSDLTRRELSMTGYDLNDSDVVWGTIFWKAGMALQEGKGVIMESTYLDEGQRRPDYDLARSKYSQGMFIETICPEEIAKDRISSRSLSPDGIHVPTNRVEYYDKKKDEWEQVIPGLMKVDRSFISYMIYNSYKGTLHEGFIREGHRSWANKIADSLGVSILPKDSELINFEKRYQIR